MGPLQDKIALIIGTSPNLGAALARQLASVGAHVCLADREPEYLRPVQDQIIDSGGQASIFKADMAEDGQAEMLIHQVFSQFKQLDYLVYTVEQDPQYGLDALTTTTWDYILAVNLRAFFTATRAALQVMRVQGSGHIVALSAQDTLKDSASAAYLASKWGRQGYMRALYNEAQPQGVKVTLVTTDRLPDTTPPSEPCYLASVLEYLLSTPPKCQIPEIKLLINGRSWV
jgi:short-subunit dehydrogenase